MVEQLINFVRAFSKAKPDDEARAEHEAVYEEALQALKALRRLFEH